MCGNSRGINTQKLLDLGGENVREWLVHMFIWDNAFKRGVNIYFTGFPPACLIVYNHWTELINRVYL